MSIAATTQLNVRMDKAVRAEGDRVLRARGYTPAEFVRKVWSRLAQRGEGLEEMMRLVESGPAAQEGVNVAAGVSVRTESPASACRAEELWAELEQVAGLGSWQASGAGYVELPYKDLLEEAYAEELR